MNPKVDFYFSKAKKWQEEINGRTFELTKLNQSVTTTTKNTITKKRK